MRDTNRMAQVESRLLAIPIIFILLRMWGTIQFFFSLAVADHVNDGCVPNSTHIAFFVLGILQVHHHNNMIMIHEIIIINYITTS